jgi:hypothetical protein
VIAAALAVNVAVLEPAATFTESGTASDPELSSSLTVLPPLGAAALRVTEQVINDGGLVVAGHCNADRTAAPVEVVNAMVEAFETPLDDAVTTTEAFAVTFAALTENVA